MLAPAIAALPGWTTVKELPTAIGTVALVAVGPAGAFAIEHADGTGVRSLADVPERALIHVWAQAKHLERQRLGGAVTPVLALDGAAPAGPAGRRRGVRVLPAVSVTAWLAAQPAALTDAEVERLRRRLEGTPLRTPAPTVLAA
jgi:hypothetical protein